MKRLNKLSDENKKKILAFLAILIFIVFSALIGWFVGRPMLRFVKEPALFRQWVNSHGFFGRLLFIGMVILQIVVAVIPGEPLEFGGGYAFGAFEGTVLCMIGAVAGSLLVFLLVRRFGTLLVEVFFSKEKLEKLKFLKHSQKRDILLFIIYMVPGTPKDIISYFAGLTDIKFSTWLWICVVGRFPSIISSTVSGSALGEESYLMAVIVVVITLALSGLGLLLYNYICKKHNKLHTKENK